MAAGSIEELLDLLYTEIEEAKNAEKHTPNYRKSM